MPCRRASCCGGVHVPRHHRMACCGGVHRAASPSCVVLRWVVSPLHVAQCCIARVSRRSAVPHAASSCCVALQHGAACCVVVPHRAVARHGALPVCRVAAHRF